MSYRFKFCFILLILVSFNQTSAIESLSHLKCIDILVTAAKVERIKSGIANTSGFTVIERKTREEGFDGGYQRQSNIIHLNSEASDLDKKVFLHHEAVHIKTGQNFEKNPTAENAAMAITFSRENAPISTGLHPAYKNYYSIDEIKAYSKTALLTDQIAEKWKENGLKSRGETLWKSIEFRNRVNIFKSVSLAILKETRKKILDSIQGKKQLTVTPFYYSADTPHHFVLQIAIEQKDGEPILVNLPVYDPLVESNGHKMKNYEEKALQTCEAAILYLESLSK